MYEGERGVWLQTDDISTCVCMYVCMYVQADEYEQLGSYALIGLPEALYPQRYGKLQTLHVVGSQLAIHRCGLASYPLVFFPPKSIRSHLLTYLPTYTYIPTYPPTP